MYFTLSRLIPFTLFTLVTPFPPFNQDIIHIFPFSLCVSAHPIIHLLTYPPYLLSFPTPLLPPPPAYSPPPPSFLPSAGSEGGAGGRRSHFAGVTFPSSPYAFLNDDELVEGRKIYKNPRNAPSDSCPKDEDAVARAVSGRAGGGAGGRTSS